MKKEMVKMGTMKIEYDDEHFFREYAQMDRSKYGLDGAGEWHQLKPLFPALAGKRVLDLGCGYGWHCRFAAEQGADCVLGIDVSERILAEARRRGGERITYRLCAIEDYEFPENAWDCVLSNLALHYIEDLDAVFRKVRRTLRPSGVFLFNIEHPVFTAGVRQEWLRDENGEILCWPVDDYFRPGRRQTDFLGCEVTKYHHTLTQILMGLRRASFRLEAVEEAQPPAEMMGQPGMADELRRPMMLLVKAVAEKRAADDAAAAVPPDNAVGESGRGEASD